MLESNLFTSAKKFEYATLGFGALYQLGAGLEYLHRVGLDRIEAHTVGLAARLHQGLASRGLPLLTPAGNGSSVPERRDLLWRQSGRQG